VRMLVARSAFCALAALCVQPVDAHTASPTGLRIIFVHGSCDGSFLQAEGGVKAYLHGPSFHLCIPKRRRSRMSTVLSLMVAKTRLAA